MRWLFLAGEAPGDGGYMVGWHGEAPPVHQCRPVLEQLCLHDWAGRRNWLHQPVEERLSWRIIDHRGRCRTHFDAPDRSHTEDAWLAGVDLQQERGQIVAREPEGFLVLVAGLLRLQVDTGFCERLARAHHFIDYRLGFRGPAGEWLDEANRTGTGDYRFLEKHEGFVVADREAAEALSRR